MRGASGPRADGTPAHPDDDIPLAEGGNRWPQAYADAVATYLAFTVSNLTDRNSASRFLGGWKEKHVRNTFGRQALPMVWDYSEVKRTRFDKRELYQWCEKKFQRQLRL